MSIDSTRPPVGTDREGGTPRPLDGRRRSRNASKAQAELLAIATQEFARLGYYGARVDEIAAKSSTTKRMIYYYFGDKDGLFTAVLERAYANIRAAERGLDLAGLTPLEALQALIEHTLRWHAEHPEMAKLVSAENALDAVHLRNSPRQAGLNLPILEVMEKILRDGREEGLFVRDVTGLELHLHMSALALFRVTNVPSVEATFGVRMDTEEALRRVTGHLSSMICTWLCTPEAV